MQTGANGDLWCELSDVIRAKSLCVQATKVKAHAESEVLEGRVELHCRMTDTLQ